MKVNELLEDTYQGMDEAAKWSMVRQGISKAIGLVEQHIVPHDHKTWVEMSLHLSPNISRDEMEFTADMLDILFPKLLKRYELPFRHDNMAEVVFSEKTTSRVIILYADRQ